MSKISELDMAIKDLCSVATTIDGLANTMAEMFSTTADEAPDATVPAEPVLTLEQVRAVLADKSCKGHTAVIRALLQMHIFHTPVSKFHGLRVLIKTYIPRDTKQAPQTDNFRPTEPVKFRKCKKKPVNRHFYIKKRHTAQILHCIKSDVQLWWR